MSTTLKRNEIKNKLAESTTESIIASIALSKKHASYLNRVICYANLELKKRKKNETL